MAPHFPALVYDGLHLLTHFHTDGCGGHSSPGAQRPICLMFSEVPLEKYQTNWRFETLKNKPPAYLRVSKRLFHPKPA